jgi:hypothetical protein
MMKVEPVPLVSFATAESVAWFPESLREPVNGDAADLQDWSYIVVEEIVDAVAVLHRWPWPRADQRGALLWPEDGQLAHVEAVVPRDVLIEQLYRPLAEVTRKPRTGDVFATPKVGSAWASDGLVADLRDLLPDEVYDISADAYEACRLAYQSGTSTMFPAESDDSMTQILDSMAAERRERQAPHLRVAAPGSTGGAR